MERSNSLTDLIHIVDVALYTTTYPKLVEYLNTIDGMVDMVPIKDGIKALVKCCLFMDAMHAPERVILVVTCATGRALRKKGRKRRKRSGWTRPSKSKGKRLQGKDKQRSPTAAFRQSASSIAMFVANYLMDDDDNDNDFEHGESNPNPWAKSFRHLNLHTMIVGPSGCCKTTVALHLAAIYMALGLTNDTFTAIAPQNLKEKYCVWTAANLKEEISKNTGGLHHEELRHQQLWNGDLE